MQSRRDFLKLSLSVMAGAVASQLPGIPRMGGFTETPHLLKPTDEYVIDQVLAKASAGYIGDRYLKTDKVFPFESLIAGIHRYNPMIIDNFGISINMSDIPPWQELTDEERRTAFTDHVLSKVDPETEIRMRERLA